MFCQDRHETNLLQLLANPQSSKLVYISFCYYF